MTLKIAFCVLGLLCCGNLGAVVLSEDKAVLERCKNEFDSVTGVLGRVRTQFRENLALIVSHLVAQNGFSLFERLIKARLQVEDLKSRYLNDDEAVEFREKIELLLSGFEHLYSGLPDKCGVRIADAEDLRNSPHSQSDVAFFAGPSCGPQIQFLKTVCSCQKASVGPGVVAVALAQIPNEKVVRCVGCGQDE
jgi:hypothetical protein